MKILNLSLDNSALDKNSKLAERVLEYGGLVAKYLIIVPNKINCEVRLSEKVKVHGAKSTNKIFGLINIFNLAKKLIKQKKIDIITVQDQYYLALIGWLLAKKFNIGLEIQIHGFEKYYGLRKLIAKFVISKADAVRSVSQRLKKRLVDEFGVEENKITVVPIYSDVRCQMSDFGYNKAKDKFVFLTVGRLVPVKNIKMQIEAMAKIVGTQNFVSANKKVELWVVGDGSEMRNLKFEIRNLGLDKNVKLLGWQDNPDQFYRQADAFLLTSHSEGWGMAVIEAGSYGLPIIMTDVGCAREVIKDGESGIIIPVGHQSKLEESMVKLIQGEDLRSGLGENARQAVSKLPNREQILELYKESWVKVYRVKSL